MKNGAKILRYFDTAKRKRIYFDIFAGTVKQHPGEKRVLSLEDRLLFPGGVPGG